MGSQIDETPCTCVETLLQSIVYFLNKLCKFLNTACKALLDHYAH